MSVAGNHDNVGEHTISFGASAAMQTHCASFEAISFWIVYYVLDSGSHCRIQAQDICCGFICGVGDAGICVVCVVIYSVCSNFNSPHAWNFCILIIFYYIHVKYLLRGVEDASTVDN